MSIVRKTADRLSSNPSNVKTFLFFLGFTSLLWVFIQFSKNYTKEILVHLQYTDLPKNKILNTKSDKKLRLLLKGNGFSLLQYTWHTPRLDFKMTEAIPYKSSTDTYYFHITKETAVLKHKLNFEGQILSTQKDTLKVVLDVSLNKKIPVIPKGKIAYADGYGSDTGMVITPDSVDVQGPKRIVDTLHAITTESFNITALNTTYRETLPLQIGKQSKVVISPTSVQANIIVSKFTEGNVQVPIIVENTPSEEEVKVFPRLVNITYRVAMKHYNEVKPSDFSVIADYNTATLGSSFLIVKLVKSPDQVYDVRLQDKQVQYVILK